MSFTSTFPTNSIKMAPPGLTVIPTISVCNMTLKYVKTGDIIDPDNHKNVMLACKNLAYLLTDWDKAVGVIQG
jgi:hypothetical protein